MTNPSFVLIIDQWINSLAIKDLEIAYEGYQRPAIISKSVMIPSQTFSNFGSLHFPAVIAFIDNDHIDYLAHDYEMNTLTDISIISGSEGTINAADPDLFKKLKIVIDDHLQYLKSRSKL